MLLECDVKRLGDFDVPTRWQPYVEVTGAGLRVISDRTGYRELYLHCGSDSATLATGLGELLDHLRTRGSVVELLPRGISGLMQDGFVRLPYTEFRDIYFLALGYRTDLAFRNGSFDIEFADEYPWGVRHSRNDQEPDPATLLRLLTAAGTRQLAEWGNDGLLMLSSGKDSPAVALALAEAGLTHIGCVTYSSGSDDPEPPIAADICRRLGLSHQIIEMPTDPKVTADMLTRFFTASARPGVDLAQVPYALAVAAAGPVRGAIIDGSGNDTYMGYPVSGHDLTKLRLRIRGRRLAGTVQRVVPPDSSLGYLARSRVATTFRGRLLRAHEVRDLYSAAEDTSAYWYRISADTRRVNDFDMYGEVSGRHTEPAGVWQKTRVAAHAVGMGVSLPWCDEAVADYYFNLPERSRYELKPPRNKVLLRDMLLRYLDYDADAIGKYYFSFDGARFITRNKEYVRSEIDGCRLWSREGLRRVHQWLDQIESRPLLYHSLLTLLMISGWHNHSRYLT